MLKKIIYLLMNILLFSHIITAEMSFNSIFKDYGRTMQLIGETEGKSLNYHTYSSDLHFDEIEFGPWKNVKIKDSIMETPSLSISILSPEIWTSWNSTTAWGGNDGSLWQGKGFNSVLSGGLEINNPYFSIRLYPEIWGAQNLDIDIIDTTSSSGYGDFWTVFDNLQRYGDKSYFDFSWGQSDIRFYWDKFTLGFSNESIILGPGQMNNIILSDNAGGFPHFDFGTMGKTDLGRFGTGEFRVIWGFLKESEFFDSDSSNDYGWISGSYFSISPSIIPNFTVGFNYQYYKPLSGWDSWDLVRSVPFLDRSNSPTDLKDMMISIPFSWIFPSIGFEVYGEWARNDNFGGIRDLFKFPEHTQAYTLGVSQILKKSGDQIIQLSLEMTTMAQERTYEIRAAGPWYRHAWAGWAPGYTNNGQLLGAAIGPGSDSQWAKVSWINSKGSSAVFMQRIAHDKDYYYAIESDPGSGVFAEFNIGLEKVVFVNNFDIYGRGVFVTLINNNFIGEDDLYNVHFELGMRYHL